MNFIDSLSPQMQGGIAFFLFVGTIVFVLTQRLFAAAQKDRMVSALKAKQVGMSEQAASAILSVERQAQKGSGRSDKMFLDPVNFKAINRDLRKAGLPAFPPLVFAAAALMSFLIARFILNVPIFPLELQAAVVFPPMYLMCRYSFVGMLVESRKMKALLQMIHFIEAVQRAVSVGASPDEAVADAIADTEKPLQESLMAVKDLLDLGYDFVDAINLGADRVDLPEFDIFAASLAAQASSGGTIGTVLKDVIEIARSRMDLKKKISTMTAEGQFNAILLGSLPIGLSLYLRLSQPDYFAQLWGKPAMGSMIFFGTIGMAVFGAFLAMRISKIKL